MTKKIKYQNPYYVHPPENTSGLPSKNRPVLLSDELAKAAMQGMMVNFGPEDEYTLKDIAKIAYEVADEMLRARHEYMVKVKVRSREGLIVVNPIKTQSFEASQLSIPSIGLKKGSRRTQ